MHNNGQKSLRGFKDYKDCYFDLWKPENFAAGSSSRQPRMESFCCCPSTSNCFSQFKGSPFFHEDPRFRPTAIYNFENYQFREIKNNGLHSGGDYAATNNDRTSSYQWIHQGSETFAEAQLQFDLVFLQEILEKGDYEQIDMLFFMLQGSYLTLMIDQNMCIVFQKLVDVCRGEQLNALVAEVLSWSQLFTNAAFCRQGYFQDRLEFITFYPSIAFFMFVNTLRSFELSTDDVVLTVQVQLSDSSKSSRSRIMPSV